MIGNLLSQVSVGRIREHIRSLEGVRNPITAPEALERAADYIHASLAPLKYKVETHTFRESDREFRNIVATRLGARCPDERILVIAHYDTVEVSPGADDNASGVAVLLELARVLEPLEFGRTVQFVAVNLEERQREGPLEVAGLFGSRAFATDAEKQGWKIEGVVVFDAIAYAGEQIPQATPDGLPVKLPEIGDFITVVGNAASSDLVRMLVQTVAQHRISLPVVPFVVPGNGEMLLDTRRSDHSSFWDRGYQAVMLTDTANFRNPNYHQASDTLETLNVAFAAEVCRAVAAMVAELAK